MFQFVDIIGAASAVKGELKTRSGFISRYPPSCPMSERGTNSGIVGNVLLITGT